jgi:hypothetical protein
MNMSEQSGNKPTAPVALKIQTRLQLYVRNIALQMPSRHQFSAHDLRCTNPVKNNRHFKVAAIPLDRLEAFVCREGIQQHDYCCDKGHKTAGILTSKIGECFHGKLKGIYRKREAAKTIS